MDAPEPNHVAHAKKLLGDGLSEQRVKQELMWSGLSDEQAATTVRWAAKRIDAMPREIEQRIDQFRAGTLLGAGGLAATVALYFVSVYAYFIFLSSLTLFSISILLWIIYAQSPSLARWIEENKTGITVAFVMLVLAFGLYAVITAR